MRILTQEHKEAIRKALSGRKITWANKISASHLGRPKSKLHRQHLSESHKGLKHSQEHKDKIGKAHIGLKHTKESRLKMSLLRRGKNSYLWKGGISPLNKLIRRSFAFRNWREAVFKRDNWTCQECYQRGGELHPHHLQPFATFPELRFELTNGQTLCADCHHKTPSWGRQIVSA